MLIVIVCLSGFEALSLIIDDKDPAEGTSHQLALLIFKSRGDHHNHLAHPCYFTETKAQRG